MNIDRNISGFAQAEKKNNQDFDRFVLVVNNNSFPRFAIDDFKH